MKKHEHEIFKMYTKPADSSYYKTIYICAKCGRTEWWLDYGMSSEKKVFKMKKKEINKLMRQKRLIRMWHGENLRVSDALSRAR